MRVQLISNSPDPFWLVVKAARECYSSDSTSLKSDDKLFLSMLKRDETPLEHAVFSFRISDVSRVLTHQLVRHRVASFNQQSQRYVEAEGRYFVPDLSYLSEDKHKPFLDSYHRLMLRANDLYHEAINDGVKREDARYILPPCTYSSLVMTMNLRELKRFFALRLSPRAQKEIRDLARIVLSLVVSCLPIHLAEEITSIMLGTKE